MEDRTATPLVPVNERVGRARRGRAGHPGRLGGGLVAQSDSYETLLAHCYTVWVRATPSEHMARVVAQGDLRPMAGNAEAMLDLNRILTAREPLYRRADAILDTSGEPVESSFAQLQRLTAG